MKILCLIAFLLVVGAVIYRHVVSRYCTGEDKILENCSILAFFQNNQNFGAYCMLERKPLLVELFWRINGQSQKIDFFAPVVSMFYIAEINRVVLVTFEGVCFYDTQTAQKEELDIASNCTFLLCNRNPGDTNLLLLGHQSNGKVLKSICVYLDLITKKSHLFEIEEDVGNFKGACKTADYEYYAKTNKNLYKITPSLIERCETYSDSDEANQWLLDRWPNGKLIFERIQNNARSLLWNGMELELGSIFDSIVSGEYLWIIDNKYNLAIYDFLGHAINNHQLNQQVSGCGKLQDGGIWVFYSDSTIDVFGKDGVKKSTKHLEIGLLSKYSS